MTKTELERRVEQLEADVATIARQAFPHVHPKDGLLEIIERYSPDGRETRPHHAPESRGGNAWSMKLRYPRDERQVRPRRATGAARSASWRKPRRSGKSKMNASSSVESRRRTSAGTMAGWSRVHQSCRRRKAGA